MKGNINKQLNRAVQATTGLSSPRLSSDRLRSARTTLGQRSIDIVHLKQRLKWS